jgi:hypothetical protein
MSMKEALKQRGFEASDAATCSDKVRPRRARFRPRVGYRRSAVLAKPESPDCLLNKDVSRMPLFKWRLSASMAAAF